ncbi:MAG: DUF1697 domain-containing protein [Bauldia sp.]|nr:DUF1697 domain-containing protein [Bauldia sp.]
MPDQRRHATAPRYAVFLRGVNVGGVKVPMAELRAMAEAMGFSGVKTLLQSGNLVLADPKARPAAELETLLEAEAKGAFGRAIDFMIRTPEELDAAIAANPFPEMAKDDPSHLVVHFLKGNAPDHAAIAALNAAISGPERAATAGRELYITYPDGIGTSKLSNSLIEKMLGKQRATGRNWNTVLKMAALLAG